MKDAKPTAAAVLLGLAAAAIAAAAAVPGGAGVLDAAEPGPAAAPGAAADAARAGAGAAGAGAGAAGAGAGAAGAGAGAAGAGAGAAGAGAGAAGAGAGAAGAGAGAAGAGAGAAGAEAGAAGAEPRALPGDEPECSIECGLPDAVEDELRALQEEHDAVLAEYGFRSEWPDDITEEELAEMGKRLLALNLEYERQVAILPDAGARLPDHAPGTRHPASLDELQARMAAEAEEIMRGYGFVIANPDLSEEDEACMRERLAEIEAEMDALFWGPEGAPAPEPGGRGAARGADAGSAQAHGREADPEREAALAAGTAALQAEHDAVLAEYGFWFEAPRLAAEEFAEMEERLAALESIYERRMAQVLPVSETMTIFYFPSAELLAKLDGLSARLAAEADDIMRGYGYVIARPDLSVGEEARMNERLAAIADRMDALHGGAPAEPGGCATAQQIRRNGE